jgi:hypothetical protein
MANCTTCTHHPPHTHTATLPSTSSTPLRHIPAHPTQSSTHTPPLLRSSPPRSGAATQQQQRPGPGGCHQLRCAPRAARWRLALVLGAPRPHTSTRALPLRALLMRMRMRMHDPCTAR